MELGEIASIVVTVGQITLVPLVAVLWKFHGRLSTIEGRLDTLRIKGR